MSGPAVARSFWPRPFLPPSTLLRRCSTGSVSGRARRSRFMSSTAPQCSRAASGSGPD